MAVSVTLPYSAEVLQAFLAGYHESIWPAQIAAVLLIAALLVVLARPTPRTTRLPALILTAFWAWVGGVFYMAELTHLSFLATAHGAACLGQAALLLGHAGRGPEPVAQRSRARLSFGIGLLVVALGVYPLGMAVWEGSAAAWRLAGVTPVATALLTLGALILGPGGRWTAGLLGVIPAAVLAWAAFTAWVLA
ncbi:DUF6064 family protein [Roseospira navarrensis]|uniref:MFS transporter permease n=1 Tax=Roseospira navarrensis TaxID=140058 RepID=A0A7X1ZC52_9PROT|nr:DUF6064 family protein [Roseospira navarrensis]MQX35825.1 hypothetical protein [Roseospira navarrensis]